MHLSKSLVAMLASASVGSMHMIMKTPVPYGKDSLNNSPLDASGSDYPCKQRPGVYDKGSADNKMAIGQPQTLSFTGSATHGGGSCQISVTKDLKPTKDSDFRVIASIEGGCPASTAGNLGNDPNSSGASTFQYSIPEDVSPGDYTLAWTWFNKIGNREMYMNCAPITVTGSKKRDIDNSTIPAFDENTFEKRDGLSSLPAMFKANILSVSGDCKTTDNQDLAFPDPGKNVQKHTTGALAPPVGGSCASSKAAAGAQGAQAGGAGAAQVVSASPSASANASAAVPTVSLPALGTPSTHTILASAAAMPAPAAVATPEAAPAAAPSGSTGSTGGSLGGMSCGPDGKTFKLPGGPSQPVAAGTVCKDGQIAFAGVKRSAKFPKAFYDA